MTCLNRHATHDKETGGEYMRLHMMAVSLPIVQSQDPFIPYHSCNGVQTCLVFPHLPSLTWEEEAKMKHHNNTTSSAAANLPI